MCIHRSRGEKRKGDILIADIEELEKLDASEIYHRTIKAKEVLIFQEGDEFIFPIADGTAKSLGRDIGFREPTLRRERTVRSEDLSGELQGESEEPQPTESRDNAEARRVTCEHAGNRCRQILTTSTQTRRNEQGTSNQPFTDNLEELETHVPAHSSERENSDAEGDTSKVVTQKRKHSIYTHFPNDRKCDICLTTKTTRVPCRRRDEGSIPRAEKFGDLITADHKVFNEGSESPNNHRYAVVVQDLATQWIQSYPCKTKNSQDTQKSLPKFPEPSQKP